VNTKANNGNDDGRNNRRNTNTAATVYRGILGSTEEAFVREDDAVPELVQSASLLEDNNNGAVVPEIVQSSASVIGGGYSVPPELIRDQSSTSLSRAFEPMFTFSEYDNMK